MIRISGIVSQGLFEPVVVLLRSTTWKCGKVERLVINYLRRQLHVGQNYSSLKGMLEHFETKEMQPSQMLDAMERLEKRNIIRIVSDPFSSHDDYVELNTQGGN